MRLRLRLGFVLLAALLGGAARFEPVLRAGATFGRPVMQWGHEWVVATGVGQFQRQAFS